MDKNYEISRKKFFDTQERKAIMSLSEDKANADLAKGRTIWVTRYMLVHLAMYSGLRVSELAALKIKDCILTKKEPYIKVRHGKGGKSREVYIDRELTKHLKWYLKQKKAWNQSTEPDAPLFSGQGGKHVTTNTLYLSFKQAVKETGLRDDLSIHSARHTFATLLLHKTQNLRLVQKRLGHSHINMTTLYSDILPEKNGELANMILD